MRRMKKLKIVFLDEYSVDAADTAAIRALGDYTGYEYIPDDQIIEASCDADVVITNKKPLGADAIAALPRLKLICVAATGMNNIDLEAAAKAGVVVKNAIDYSTHAVAESTLTGALALFKQILYYDNFVKSGIYAASPRLFDFGRPTYQLHGKRWGIIGLGNIGRRVAQLAQAFGCEVAYHSTSGKNHNNDYPAMGLDELLAWADVLSIHAPYSERTRNLIDYPQLQRMKPASIVINVARGGIVNEAGLARALDEGLVAGAAMDVYTAEPIATDNPLNFVRDKYRLVLTPHSAWSTKETLQVLVDKIAENIRTFIATGQ